MGAAEKKDASRKDVFFSVKINKVFEINKDVSHPKKGIFFKFYPVFEIIKNESALSCLEASKIIQFTPVSKTKRLFLCQKGYFHPERRVWKQPNGNFLVHKGQFSSVFETKGTYSLKKKHFHTNEKGHSAPPHPALSEVKEKFFFGGGV